MSFPRKKIIIYGQKNICVLALAKTFFLITFIAITVGSGKLISFKAAVMKKDFFSKIFFIPVADYRFTGHSMQDRFSVINKHF